MEETQTLSAVHKRRGFPLELGLFVLAAIAVIFLLTMALGAIIFLAAAAFGPAEPGVAYMLASALVCWLVVAAGYAAFLTIHGWLYPEKVHGLPTDPRGFEAFKGYLAIMLVLGFWVWVPVTAYVALVNLNSILDVSPWARKVAAALLVIGMAAAAVSLTVYIAKSIIRWVTQTIYRAIRDAEQDDSLKRNP